MPKHLIYLITSTLSLILLASCGNPKASEHHHDLLIVGTNGEFAPFTYIENGELVGFDIDIAKEVSTRMGKKIQFKDMPFDALIPDLALGNVDFLAAGMSYTEERAQRVLFTKPYLSGDPLMIFTLAKDNAPKSLDDLKGKTVVVNEGYTADTLMTGIPTIQLLRLSAPSDAFLAVKNGRAEAFITSQSTIATFLKTQESSKFESVAINGTGETCALVLSKQNPELLEKIQQALDSMEADGTLVTLKQKWKL